MGGGEGRKKTRSKDFFLLLCYYWFGEQRGAWECFDECVSIQLATTNNIIMRLLRCYTCALSVRTSYCYVAFISAQSRFPGRIKAKQKVKDCPKGKSSSVDGGGGEGREARIHSISSDPPPSFPASPPPSLLLPIMRMQRGRLTNARGWRD